MSTAIDGTGASPESPADDRGFFGHPRGLSTLFFTEMWERFSYYGMRAILTLYMTKALVDGGLGFDEKYAALIYATYVSSVWYLPLIGGWLADRVFGARRAVLIGGIVIALGHFSMAINTHFNFYAGLILIACGTGLLKPNISAMVGQLYSERDKRRDAGFSILHGNKSGRFLSPIVVGFLAQHRRFATSSFRWASIRMRHGTGLRRGRRGHDAGTDSIFAWTFAVESRRRKAGSKTTKQESAQAGSTS